MLRLTSALPSLIGAKRHTERGSSRRLCESEGGAPLVQHVG